MVVAAAFAQAAILLADSGKTTSFSPLVHRVANPVYPGVSSDSFVVWINQNDFKVFIDAVLVHPVGVKDSEIPTPSPDTLFSGAPQASLVL